MTIRIYSDLRNALAADRQEIATLLRRDDIDIVHAERHSGKSGELLFYVKERFHGEAIVVAHDENAAMLLKQRWHNALTWSDSDVTKVTSPKFVSARTLNEDHIRGHKTPIVVDEWRLIGLGAQDLLLRTELFHKAVTT